MSRMRLDEALRLVTLGCHMSALYEALGPHGDLPMKNYWRAKGKASVSEAIEVVRRVFPEVVNEVEMKVEGEDGLIRGRSLLVVGDDSLRLRGVRVNGGDLIDKRSELRHKELGLLVFTLRLAFARNESGKPRYTLGELKMLFESSADHAKGLVYRAEFRWYKPELRTHFIEQTLMSLYDSDEAREKLYEGSDETLAYIYKRVDDLLAYLIRQR